MKESLVERGITFTEDEFGLLFNSLQFDDNHSDQISRQEIYANGHLFNICGRSSELSRRIALGCGVGITEQDFVHFEKFKERVVRLTDVADENNCSLLIDAE